MVAEESAAPLAGARVISLRSARVVSTDGFGRFLIWLDDVPDTLVAGFIGRAPDTLLVSRPAQPLLIRLRAAPVRLSDLTVTTPGAGLEMDLSRVNRWELPADALRMVPAAVEVDPLRALSLVPAVSYTTPVSARPLIRGYGADQSSIRLDGFELVNPYHIGRFFGALPSEAVEQVTLSAGPFSANTGGALAGVIDITGRSGPGGDARGGGTLSLISASPWAAGGTGNTWFGAGRLVHLSALDFVTSSSIPYNFEDLYLSGALQQHGKRNGRATLFASRDHLLDRGKGSGMDWNNLLAGTRWRLTPWSGAALDLAASATRFAEDGTGIEARNTRIDLRNRFARGGGSAALTLPGTAMRLQTGASIYWRSISNRVQPEATGSFPSQDLSFGRAEIGAYVEVARALGPASAEAGLRVDAAGGASLWQPRLRLRLPLSRQVVLSAGAGRSGRLYQLISDPRSEPEVAFYDFWIPAGEQGVPIPRVDQATAELEVTSGRWRGRLAGFASRAHGLGELRPPSDQRPGITSEFRFGRGRTAGVEAQVSVTSSGGGSSLSLSYILSSSRRNWGSGWVPWSQDRRHTLRLFGQLAAGRHWSFFGTVDAATGVPLTPVISVIQAGIPDSLGFTQPTYVYGRENSVRTAGTVRGDIGSEYAFGGPWRSRMWLGISVINLGFGPVAPVVVKEPSVGIQRVEYDRLFDLPAVPTVRLRVEF